MIRIDSISKAKQVTKSVFDYMKTDKKPSLNGLRAVVAKEFGFSQLSDAFQNENAEKLEFMKSRVFTMLDDPRVTVEMARKISTGVDCDEDEYQNAEEYFIKHFEGKENEVPFPIKSTSDLISRCNEIMIIYGELDLFATRDLLSVLFKMSLENNRIGYVYTDDVEFFNENPEFAMAYQVHYQLFTRSCAQFVGDMIGMSDSDYSCENGYYDLFEKMKIFSRSIIWTQSNVGRSVYNTAREKSKRR